MAAGNYFRWFRSNTLRWRWLLARRSCWLRRGIRTVIGRLSRRLCVWNAQIGWHFVGWINVARNTALRTGFAETACDQIRFAILGNAIGHTYTRALAIYKVNRERDHLLDKGPLTFSSISFTHLPLLLPSFFVGGTFSTFCVGFGVGLGVVVEIGRCVVVDGGVAAAADVAFAELLSTQHF